MTDVPLSKRRATVESLPVATVASPISCICYVARRSAMAVARADELLDYRLTRYDGLGLFGIPQDAGIEVS